MTQSNNGTRHFPNVVSLSPTTDDNASHNSSLASTVSSEMRRSQLITANDEIDSNIPRK